MSCSTHVTASTGFQAEADSYAKARPSYPQASIDQIDRILHQIPLHGDERYHVLDLGAGTGIMTHLLTQHNYTLTAVEPLEAMRQKLQELCPSVTALKGTASSIPVESNSQHLVMMAQCFHWFDNLESLIEIHRVLKPGGVVVLIWNMESQERSEWVHSIRQLYQVYDGTAPQYRCGHWKNVFEATETKQLFKLPLEHEQYVLDTEVRRSQIWTRVKSKSYIAILDKLEQEKLRVQVEKVLDEAGLPKDDTELIEYPHDTDMYWCFRK